MKALLPAALAMSLGFAALSSCDFGIYELFGRPNDVITRAASLTEVAAPSVANTQRYTFAIITDPHFGMSSVYYFPESEFFNSVTEASADKPEFLLVLGDVTNTGVKAEYQDFADFAQRFTEACGIPYYAVAGNHDLYNDGWTTWAQTVNPGTSFYRFALGRRSFYFLDTGNGTLGDPQLEKLSAEMNADANRKLVFTHYPLFGGISFSYFKLTNSRERKALIDLFNANSVDMYFAGHWHDGAFYDYSCFKEEVLSAFYATKSRPGRWFFATVDEGSHTLSLKTYAVESASGGTAVSTQEFSLKN
jgi:3',5'-cyclic AMP phosphodiesterase CpdA